MEGSKASVEIEDFLCEVQQVRFENHPIELQGGMILPCALQGVESVRGAVKEEKPGARADSAR